MVSVSFEPELAADAARELRGTLRGGVIAATDQTYDTARRIWNGAIDRHPALIARPENEREVVAAIDVARKYRLPLTVRGGAHDFAGRAGSCGILYFGGARGSRCRRCRRTDLIGHRENESTIGPKREVAYSWQMQARL
jgi:hypothetical protein